MMAGPRVALRPMIAGAEVGAPRQEFGSFFLSPHFGMEVAYVSDNCCVRCPVADVLSEGGVASAA